MRLRRAEEGRIALKDIALLPEFRGRGTGTWLVQGLIDEFRIYTRVLTLNSLSAAKYYAYLALYNLVYVLPLIIIYSFLMRNTGFYDFSIESIGMPSTAFRNSGLFP